jgi:hypothetical protein
MKYYVLNLRTFKTVTASSKSEAERLGNGSIIFGSAEELAKDPNTTGQILCRAYNEMSPVQIDRFADKVSGAKRLFKLVHSSASKNEFNFDKPAKELAADSRPDEMELYREKVLKVGSLARLLNVLLMKILEPKRLGMVLTQCKL